MRLPVPSTPWRGVLQASFAWPLVVAVVLVEVDGLAVVEGQMTEHDRKYGGRTITLDKGTAERLEQFRLELEKELGCPISYRLAVAIAIQRAKPK